MHTPSIAPSSMSGTALVAVEVRVRTRVRVRVSTHPFGAVRRRVLLGAWPVLGLRCVELVETRPLLLAW